MNKTKILIIVCIAVGLIAIATGVFYIMNKQNKDQNNVETDNKELKGIVFSNLNINPEAENIKVTIDGINNTKKAVSIGLVDIHLLDSNKKELFVFTASVEDILEGDTVTIEYVIEEEIEGTINDFYVSIYKVENNSNDEDNYNEESQDEQNNSLKAILGDVLREIAKEIVESDNFTYKESFELTAKEMQDTYKKSLGDLLNTEYKCSLEDSYVEVGKDKNGYTYVSYISCESFNEEE